MLHRCGHHLAANGISPGSGLWSGTLLSALSTVLWIALFIGLAWALLRWVFPYILPIMAGIMAGIMADIFGMEPVDTPPLEILRQRYAAGEIDAVTFEQMRERLEASYHHEEPRHPS